MRRMLRSAWSLAVAGVLFGWGCGSNPNELTAADKGAFKTASPEIKQSWEAGLKADKANDFMTASTNYRSLLGRELTTEQLVAVQTALGGLNSRMNEAAAKGDASAQKAVEALKQNAPRNR